MQFVAGYRDANAPRRPGAVPKEAASSGVAATGGVSASSGEPPAAEARTIDASNPATSTQGKAKGNGNGHGNGHGPGPRGGAEETLAPRLRSVAAAVAAPADLQIDPLSRHSSEMQADAPACDVCGSITLRSGTCYKCLNCGNSMGCS
jgi:hypothetical protein